MVTNQWPCVVKLPHQGMCGICGGCLQYAASAEGPLRTLSDGLAAERRGEGQVVFRDGSPVWWPKGTPEPGWRS